MTETVCFNTLAVVLIYLPNSTDSYGLEGGEFEGRG